MIPEFDINTKEELKQQEVNRVIYFLKEGGLCVLPSDSSYVLTGLAAEQGVSRDINLLLERNGAPMTLAFGDLNKVIKEMDFDNQAYKFFRRLTPGGLTFVAQPMKKAFNIFSEKCLYADGTIGVRLTESLIETQIANIFPMPSAPIRNSDGMEASSAKEAWSIIADRSTKLHSSRKIALIEGQVKYPGRLSTVVKEELQNGFWYIKIIREGALSAENILKVALECKYKGVI